MLKTAFVICRKWGFEIFEEIYKFQRLRNDFKIDVLITTRNPEFKIDKFIQGKIRVYKVDPSDQKKIFNILTKHKIKIVFLYSWSYLINEKITNKFICLCLHPSLLPAYRGGTPIQHQLINGEKKSAVTIFRINKKIDGGDIYKQERMSLAGDIDDIFSRMVNLGTIITKQLITDCLNGELFFTPQKNINKFKLYKRRKPSQSELDLNEIKNMKFEKVYNIVRGLLDPYPNAFVSAGGKFVYIQKVIKYQTLPQKAEIINNRSDFQKLENKKIFLKLKDSYAWIARCKIRSFQRSTKKA